MSIETDPHAEATQEAKPLPPPGLNPTSIKWAAIVPLCAVVMLAIVILINVLTAPPPASTSVSPTLQKVSGITPATTDPFAALVVAGEPPPDVLGSVVVPSNASQVALPHTGGEATSFDRSIVFTSPSSSQALYTFFYDQMKGRGWKIFSTGAPTNAKGVEILAQKGASDSWYWEQGVVISNTTFAPDGTQSTTFTVRLYQASSE